MRYCDFCGGKLGKSWGLDLSGRSYCKRPFCKFKIKFKKGVAKIISKLIRKLEAIRETL